MHKLIVKVGEKELEEDKGIVNVDGNDDVVNKGSECHNPDLGSSSDMENRTREFPNKPHRIHSHIIDSEAHMK